MRPKAISSLERPGYIGVKGFKTDIKCHIKGESMDQFKKLTPRTKRFLGAGIAVILIISGVLFFLSGTPKKDYTANFSTRGPDQGTALEIADSNAPKPNIIIINCDDLGYGDLGAYGNKAIQTPRVDGLAKEGTRFTNFYAASSVCTPSRAGLLTGRYPVRTGLTFVVNAEDEPPFRYFLRKVGRLTGKLGAVDVQDDSYSKGMPADEITLPEALKQAGYRTGMVGKWHLGDFSQDPQYNPVNHGFDEFFGVPHSNDMFPFALYRNKKELEPDVGLNQERITGMYTKEAVNFINKSKDEPFFLYFAHTFPHQPLYASSKFKDKSKVGIFGDVVQEIDWSLGQVMDALKKNGIDDNTLVVFTSDNGPWYNGNTGNLRGRKGQSYEGGYRVPFIVRWPNRVMTNNVCDQATMNIDLFPTLLSLAGLSLPQDRIIDGKNILGLLEGKDTRPVHDALFFYHYEELEGVRQDKWKYFRNVNHYTWPQPVDKRSTVLGSIAKGNFGEWPNLYNMEYDPSESYDMYKRYPEIGDKLDNMMENWDRQILENPRGWL